MKCLDRLLEKIRKTVKIYKAWVYGEDEKELRV